MVGFEYTYRTTEDILSKIKLISDFTVLEMSLLLSLVLFIFLWVNFILPTIFTAKIARRKASEKRKKLNLIKQIAFQRDIEDEIEKEIKDIELKKSSAL